MQMVSAITFTANCAQAYLAGWSSLLLSIGTVTGLLIQALYFARRLRRTRAVTPPDALRERFSPLIEQINSYIGCFGGTFWGGVMLLGLANFVSAVFNIPVPVVAVVAGIIIILYSVSGGSWSVMVSDSLQALVMISICIALFILSLRAVGGFDGLFEGIRAAGLTDDYKIIMEPGHIYQATAGKVGDGYFTVGWIVAGLAMGIVMAIGLNTSYRYLAAKDERSASKAALLAAVLIAASQLVFFVPPMAARILFEQDVEALAEVNQIETTTVIAADGTAVEPQAGALWKRATLKNPADGAYAIIARKLLPPGLLGLVIVAMFAATMSSLDSCLTGTAGIFTKNVYPPLCRLFKKPMMSDKKQLKMTQILNFLLGVWAITLCLILAKNSGGGGIYTICLKIVLLMAPLSMPLTLALVIKKIPSWGPLVGMATGVSAAIVMQFGASWHPALKELLDAMMWHHRMYVTLAVSLIPTMLTTFWWKSTSQSYKDQVNLFFKKLQTPVDFRVEVGDAEDGIQMIRVGGLAMVVAFIIMLLVFATDRTIGRLTVLGIAGFIGLIALSLFFGGVRKHKKEMAEKAAE
jgi:Na+/proline symporter